MFGGHDFIRFAEMAQPGECLIYGRGERPAREAVQAMRPLVESGVLHPAAQCRDGVCTFTVQRGTGPIDLSRPRARRGAVRRRRMRKTDLTLVFEMLVRAAKAGRACPTNEEIARKCGLSDKLAASYRMRKLVHQGLIAVEDRSPYGRRVVTILKGAQAGKATCEAAIAEVA